MLCGIEGAGEGNRPLALELVGSLEHWSREECDLRYWRRGSERGLRWREELSWGRLRFLRVTIPWDEDNCFRLAGRGFFSSSSAELVVLSSSSLSPPLRLPASLWLDSGDGSRLGSDCCRLAGLGLPPALSAVTTGAPMFIACCGPSSPSSLLSSSFSCPACCFLTLSSSRRVSSTWSNSLCSSATPWPGWRWPSWLSWVSSDARQCCRGGLEEGVVAPEPVLILSCNGSVERREEGAWGVRRSGVEAPCFASRKRGAGSGKSSISCHPSELRGGAGVIESMAVSRLSKSPAPGTVALSARRLTSLASALEALKLPSPRRTIGSSTPC